MKSRATARKRFGAVAQLGERRNGIAKVRGSIPLGSTILRFNNADLSVQMKAILAVYSAARVTGAAGISLGQDV